MVSVGVLGTARIVPRGLLLPAKQTANIQVVAVASRDMARATRFAERHGIPRAFGSYQELIDTDDMDAVYVALPTGLHATWTRRALEAGKHVLCENPLATNAQLADELAQCARKHDRVLLEAMHVRYLHKLK